MCQEEFGCSPLVQKVKKKHQARTEETQRRFWTPPSPSFPSRVLKRPRLEEVAARAGYTRGAILRHYFSKEDLFLALMEHRVLTKFAAIRKVIEAEPEVRASGPESSSAGSRKPIKRWQPGALSDARIQTLRAAPSRSRARSSSHLYDLMFKSSGNDFIEVCSATISTRPHGSGR